VPDCRVLIWFFSYVNSPPDCILQGPKNNRFPIYARERRSYTYTRCTYCRMHTQTINEPLAAAYITVCRFPVPEIMDKQKAQPLLIPSQCLRVCAFVYYIISCRFGTYGEKCSLTYSRACSHTMRDVAGVVGDVCGPIGKMYLKIVCSNH
jgi:hypothetical protein